MPHVEITPLSIVQETSKKLGEINVLTINADNFAEAYAQLGKKVGVQAREDVVSRIDKLVSPEEIEEQSLSEKQQFQPKKERLQEQVVFLRECWLAMNQKIDQVGNDSSVKNAFAECLTSLRYWSNAAELDKVNSEHEVIKSLDSEGFHISSLDLALLLHNDNVGCQSGIRRKADGSIIFWHSEEDSEILDANGNLPEGNLDQKIIKLKIGRGENAREILAFNYASLLPGGAFFVENGRVTGVDSYYLNKENLTAGAMANLAVSTMLIAGKSAEIEEVAEFMKPFIDGYCVVSADAKDGKTRGKVLEFLKGEVLPPKILGQHEGNKKVKVNLADRRFSQYEDFESGDKAEFRKRIHRFQRWFSLVENSFGEAAVNTKSILRLLANRVGGMGWANANNFVLAHTVCQVLPNGEIDMWVQAGPAVKKELPKHFKIGIDGKIAEVV